MRALEWVGMATRRFVLVEVCEWTIFVREVAGGLATCCGREGVGGAGWGG